MLFVPLHDAADEASYRIVRRVTRTSAIESLGSTERTEAGSRTTSQAEPEIHACRTGELAIKNGL